MQILLILLIILAFVLAIFLILQTRRHTSHTIVENKVNAFLEEHLEIHKSKKITHHKPSTKKGSSK